MGKNTSVKINIYKKNEAEFQALHKFLSYGVSLSGIWKYEREIQKVEKYPLWKSICVHFNFRVNPVVMMLRPGEESLPLITEREKATF